MNRKKIMLSLLFTMIGLAGFANFNIQAEEDIQALKQEIEALRAEVAELKAEKEADIATDRPGFGGFFGHAGSPRGWDPFEEMQQMQDRMDRLFQNSLRRAGAPASSLGGKAAEDFFQPSLDLVDQGDQYLVKLDLPGMEKDQINLEVTENEIRVSGERDYISTHEEDDGSIYLMERQFGNFSRVIPLPADANSEMLEATYQQGVLEVKIQKKEAEAPSPGAKKISIS